MIVMTVWAVFSCMAFLSMCHFDRRLHPIDLTCSMKLDKAIVQRRLDLMAAEGVVSNAACPYSDFH